MPEFDRLPICLVGCGGMGMRHLAGYAALAGTGLSNTDLVAVCDICAESAERAAGEAERLLGRRPRVHTSVSDAIADPAVAGFDVVTDVFSHAAVVIPALTARKPVLCEKPLGLTVRACKAMIDAANRTGTNLATAENYRRDPPNRVAKAVIDSELLGHIHLMSQFSVGGDDQVIITPWRHMKARGAIGMDMGVHYTDIIQYYLGPFESMEGHGFIAEPIRRLRDTGEPITPTGEDSVVGTLRMRSGVLVQLSYVPSGRGMRWYQRSVHGRLGSLEIPRDRSGGAPVLRLADRTLRGRELLAELPEFELDEVTARLFGRDAAEYEIPFPRADAGHIAIELHDFAAAVLGNRAPEIDGDGGLTAVAALLGIYESGLLGRAVTMDEVLDGRVSGYQDELDRALGLLAPA
ncbi:MAG TPA: Gfo/Idh/MocA family oxidoreductase [Acetobacteraceae bacterium]|nr:Gfo/Idh/MocA family oxidoreductase [Acetobacteraceae bacterium]